MNRNGGRPGKAATAASINPSSMVLEASEGFVVTPQVQSIAARAAAYLDAGYPVHFSGPAGTGKTTLALHVASHRGRPVMLMHGDDARGSGEIVGNDYGYRKSKIVDNFVHSVVKTEEHLNKLWAENRLTLACKAGDTLLYDEFTRSRPETNNALLSVLEERLLALPQRGPHGDEYLEVHPEFRAIFTSNPEEYAGVHRTQDALMDRLITIKVDYYDRDTEAQITRTKSGIPLEEAEVIVDIVRELRELGVTKQGPSLRACIMIARVIALQGAHACQGDSTFTDVCRDVLGSLAAKVTRDGRSGMQDSVDEIVARHLREPRPGADFDAGPTPVLAIVGQEG